MSPVQQFGPRTTPTKSSVANAVKRGYPTMVVSSRQEIADHNAKVARRNKRA